MKDIEIPLRTERGRRYRLLEILPALLSWFVLILPILLSLISPTLAGYFILVFMMGWLFKAAGLSVRTVQGYNKLNRFMSVHWHEYLKDLEDMDRAIDRYQRKVSPSKMERWHYDNMVRLRAADEPYPKPSELYHAVIIAAYNETREVVEPTVQALVASEYDLKKVILVLAYEERGGPDIEQTATALCREYGKRFHHAMAVKHPDGVPNEVRGKGGNITHAGRQLKGYLDEKKIDPANVIVTTLDSDNRPHRYYLPHLTYTYILSEDRNHKSFQPIPMYLNNIWDAPAPMRVLATGNSFWMVIQSVRPHLLRNFSAHAQDMKALIDTDFWSVRTIVEDGHQFWRTYFRYEGKHDVLPLFVPIYQDAVIASGYLKTFKAQFIQLRRWAYGASDIPYVATKGYFTDNSIPRADLNWKFGRLLESHLSWATAPLILALAAFVPRFTPKGGDSIVAHQLPQMASRLQTVAMLGIVVMLFLSLKTLPPRPQRYKSRRNIWMVLQWVLLPVTTILFGSFAALYSQTRLAIGKYLDKFDVTEKVVKK